MKRVVNCYLPAVAALCSLFALHAYGAVYRVGEGEEYTKVSQVCGKLKPGDIVEITSDVRDNFTIAVQGTKSEPVTIRGITLVKDGLIVRPQLSPASEKAGHIVKCEGSWIVVEGLRVTGFKEMDYGKAAVVLAGRNLTLRNCHLHHNVRALCAEDATASDVLVEFCEFESNGYANLAPASLFSAVPRAIATVQHCYFHDNTGNNLLTMGFPRNVLRYNWFENQCKWTVQITTVGFSSDQAGQDLANRLLPAHSDIVGNVFASGRQTNAYGELQLGGSGPMAPGPEGDFHIAHNLFIGRRSGVIPQAAILTHGNVDRIRAYNNVFLASRPGGCQVYLREDEWDTPLTQAFTQRRTGSLPVVEGSNNWISKTAFDVPSGFANTMPGTNPGFLDLADGDFRPVAGSPLVANSLWPLPKGRIIDLVPDYEPCRGIPPDLKPKQRRRVIPAAVGPFEAAESQPAFKDDSADLFLSVRDHGGAVEWHLPFAAARRRALEYLSQGEAEKALACAKMQFILSPMDEAALDAAIESVKQMLVAVDGGDDSRAKAFDRYARYGVAGEDGRTGTGDDLENPIGGVRLDVFKRPGEYYDEFDRVVDARAGMGIEGFFYAYWWEQRWFEADKAFARLEGARFDDALGMLLPILVEAVKRPAADTVAEGGAVLRRNQYLLDHLTGALSVIARSRTGSLAGTREFVTSCMHCARYGPTGPDGKTGTADDIEVRMVVSTAAQRPAGPVSDARLDGLKAARPDSPAVNLLEKRLEVIREVGARTAYKLNFVADELKAEHPSGFLLLCPTPKELFEWIRENLTASPVSMQELTLEERKVAESCIQEELDSGDKAVIAACNRLLAPDAGAEGVENALVYLSAYMVGAHDVTTYPNALAPLVRQATDGRLHVFLVEDALDDLEEPFAAAEVLDALDELEGARWPQGERQRLLDAIEESQYACIKAVEEEAKKMEDREAAREYNLAVEACAGFLARFPDSRHNATIEFLKGTYRYRGGDYEAALEDLETFVNGNPGSAVVPSALLCEGLSLFALQRVDAAIEKLTFLVEEYPRSSAAPNALLTIGRIRWAGGEYDKARQCFQRLFDFYPDSECTAEARELLRNAR